MLQLPGGTGAASDRVSGDLAPKLVSICRQVGLTHSVGQLNKPPGDFALGLRDIGPDTQVIGNLAQTPPLQGKIRQISDLELPVRAVGLAIGTIHRPEFKNLHELFKRIAVMGAELA